MKRICLFSVLAMGILFCGCASLKKSGMTDSLELQLRDCKSELKAMQAEKETQLSALESAKQELEKKLKQEISQYQAKLAMTERGLVITFLSEVFFDSGKAEIKAQAEATLKTMAEVLNTKVEQSYLAIEGHTDNDPIKYSGWKSNWELSSSRALAVLHYFIEQCQVRPQRLSAVGYGEFRPVAANDTAEGKKQNRRVEIVILPSEIKKVKSQK